jgi:hypothetical protein
MATTAPTQELQESILSAIHKSQDITLQAIKVWVDTAGYFMPRVSYTHLPFARLLPNPYDILADSFDFAEQMLASQRRFTEDALKVTSQLLPDEAPAPPPETRGRRPSAIPEARSGPGTS